MSLKIIVLWVFASTLQFSARANADTLTAKEKDEIAAAYQNTQMAAFRKMREASAKGDSIDASNRLLKINPYQMLYEWENTGRPDTFLTGIVSQPKREISSQPCIPLPLIQEMRFTENSRLWPTKTA